MSYRYKTVKRDGRTVLLHRWQRHKQKHPVSKACAVCGGSFTPQATKRARQQTCGWSCRNALIAVRRHGVSLDEARRRVCPEIAEAVIRANMAGEPVEVAA